MHLVFCMAGIYKRFRDAGFTTPKYLLPWGGRPVLDHILEHMHTPGVFDGVLFVANRRDEAWATDLRHVLAARGLPTDTLLFVADTRGQAETALIAANHMLNSRGLDSPILFHNIDTVLRGRDFGAIKRELDEHDGYIDVFPADSEAYSYVRVDEDFIVREIAEKVVISNHATTGLYGFASARRYAELAEGCVYGKEFYISDVYKRLIAQGGRVRINASSHGHETIILGTPQEYRDVVGAGA